MLRDSDWVTKAVPPFTGHHYYRFASHPWRCSWCGQFGSSTLKQVQRPVEDSGTQLTATTGPTHLQGPAFPPGSCSSERARVPLAGTSFLLNKSSHVPPSTTNRQTPLPLAPPPCHRGQRAKGTALPEMAAARRRPLAAGGRDGSGGVRRAALWGSARGPPLARRARR